MPLAFEDRNTEPSTDMAHITSTAATSRSPAPTTFVRPPVALQAGDDNRAREAGGDVGRADAGRRQEAPEQVVRAAQRTHDERLQEPALGVPARGAQREEDGQHDAQEQRPEHRHPQDRRAGQARGVQPDVVAAEVGDVLEELRAAPPVQPAEEQGEPEHDREHPAPQALAHRLARDEEGRAQEEPPSAAAATAAR
jgi:hypothetical protein